MTLWQVYDDLETVMGTGGDFETAIQAVDDALEELPEVNSVEGTSSVRLSLQEDRTILNDLRVALRRVEKRLHSQQ